MVLIELHTVINKTTKAMKKCYLNYFFKSISRYEIFYFVSLILTHLINETEVRVVKWTKKKKKKAIYIRLIAEFHMSRGQWAHSSAEATFNSITPDYRRIANTWSSISEYHSVKRSLYPQYYINTITRVEVSTTRKKYIFKIWWIEARE